MRVLMFAQLKKVIGCPEVVLPIARPVTAEQFWTQLLAKYPQLEAYRKAVRLTCNLEFTGPGHLFNPGDEVALIPPVSGG